MRTYKKELEAIASDLIIQTLESVGKNVKPNYSKKDFLNILIIFQTALSDKIYDNQDFDDMDIESRLEMAKSCGNELGKIIHTYTGLSFDNLI